MIGKLASFSLFLTDTHKHIVAVLIANVWVANGINCKGDGASELDTAIPNLHIDKKYENRTMFVFLSSAGSNLMLCILSAYFRFMILLTFIALIDLYC
jgi:hypothetical protein